MSSATAFRIIGYLIFLIFSKNTQTMNNIALRYFFILLIIAFVGGLVFAGTPTETNTLLFEAALLIFGIQILVFLPSFLAQTEHFYDLTGGVTYLSTMGFMAYRHQQLFGQWDLRTLVLTALIALWAIRLSSFLFSRVKRVGKDGRFDRLKTSFTRFLLTWILQGLWVFMCTYPALIVLSSPSDTEFLFLGIGTSVWVLGWLYEVVADNQKTAFNKDPKNAGKFINTGVWKQSRHPNYVGEFILWTGITIIAIPVYEGLQWAALITPLFVYLLLNKVSGVNLLEERADEKWGENKDYQAYKEKTPIFFPKLF
jgi:steroid 5-alpha reductase family enzyme